MREQLDVHQAAAYLGLSEQAFRRLVHDGLIVNTEGKRGAWEIEVDELERYLEDHARIWPGALRHLYNLDPPA